MQLTRFTVFLATIVGLVLTPPAAAEKCYRKHPLRNGGFERKLRGWVLSADGTADFNVRAVEDSYSGTYAASLTAPADGQNQNKFVLLDKPLQMCENTTYSLVFAYKAAANTNAILQATALTDHFQYEIGPFVSLSQSDFTGDWTQVFGTAKTLPGYKNWSLNFFYQTLDESAPTTVQLDDIELIAVDDQ